MAQHWIDRYKHRAKEAFADTPEKSTSPSILPEHPHPPQPQLTPDGKLRRVADQKAREQTIAHRAEIEKKKAEIQKKFERDRETERSRGNG